MCHLIVCATELEAENREEVLPLEENSAFETITEVHCMVKRSLVDNIVNP